MPGPPYAAIAIPANPGQHPEYQMALGDDASPALLPDIQRKRSIEQCTPIFNCLPNCRWWAGIRTGCTDRGYTGDASASKGIRVAAPVPNRRAGCPDHHQRNDFSNTDAAVLLKAALRHIGRSVAVVGESLAPTQIWLEARAQRNGAQMIPAKVRANMQSIGRISAAAWSFARRPRICAGRCRKLLTRRTRRCCASVRPHARKRLPLAAIEGACCFSLHGRPAAGYRSWWKADVWRQTACRQWQTVT